MHWVSERFALTFRDMRIGSRFCPLIHSSADNDGTVLAVGGKMSSWNISDWKIQQRTVTFRTRGTHQNRYIVKVFRFCPLIHLWKYHMLTCYRWNFNFLASLCSWGDWFETGFVGNPEYRFCRDEAHIIVIFLGTTTMQVPAQQKYSSWNQILVI